MGNLLKYSGIVTKIRAMEAKLLTPEQFADIANLRSVPDIADYLLPDGKTIVSFKGKGVDDSVKITEDEATSKKC